MKLSASSDDDPMSEKSLNEIREKEDGGDGDEMSGSEEFESERLSTP